MSRQLCRVTDIPDGDSRGFDTGADGLPARFFVVREGERVWAYINRCPHTGAPMEWQPHRFLDLTGSYIVCGVHGALFRHSDGYCLSGPCKGRSLETLAARVEDGWVWLDDEGLSPTGECPR